MAIKSVIAGPRGKMGSKVVNMMNDNPSFQIVAYLDHEPSKLTENLNEIPIFKEGESCFANVCADVLIDFTVPDAAFSYTKAAIQNHVYTVTGTTGMSEEQIQELKQLASDYQIGCVVAPNFALGAVLMMKFAKQAARYFPHVEIIDKHHDQKVDAPSGTAIKTAKLIQHNRKSSPQGNPTTDETLDRSRGAHFDGMNIHSIRLPGYVAHHEVIFGGLGQTLSIKHDSINRESFMAGLRLAIEQVLDLQTLVHGLENLLDQEK